jgi:hypothetical protein
MAARQGVKINNSALAVSVKGWCVEFSVTGGSEGKPLAASISKRAFFPIGTHTSGRFPAGRRTDSHSAQNRAQSGWP